MVAANGPKAMDVAVRYGTGWVTTGAGGETVEEWWRGVESLSDAFDEKLASIERARETADRYLLLDAAPLYSLTSVEVFRDMVGRAQDLGFTDVITHWPREDGVYAGSESVLEQVAADVLPELTAVPMPWPAPPRKD